MKFVHYSGIAFMLVLLVSCAPQSQRSESGLKENPLVDDSRPYATLILGAESLLNYVEIVNPRIRDQGDFRQASVSVQNLTNQSYEFEYRFEWADANGFSTSKRSWRQFKLTAQEVETFQSTAKDEEATQFTFKVRPIGGTE